MICRTAPFSIILNDPYPRFQGHAILWCWISQKWYEIHSFNGILIGTYIHMPHSTVSFRMTLCDLTKIFDDTKHRVDSLRQQSYLLGTKERHIITLFPSCYIITSDKGGGKCDCPRCLTVCLSVSKITQKRVHVFGWNFVCRQVSGHGRTNQLLIPIRIIVPMTEPENLKSKVGQTGTSRRLQVIWCTAERYCLLHVVVQGPLNIFVQRTVGELRCVKVAQFSDFCLFSNTKRLKCTFWWSAYKPRGYIAEWFRFSMW